MCGRYSLTDPSPLKRRFNLEEFAETAITPRFNVAPSQQIPIIVERDHKHKLVLAHWGFQPVWMKGGKRPPPINARAETLAESRLFKPALTRNRCLIPADGFYEWKAIPGQKRKQPMYMRLKRGELFAFAGIFTGGLDEEECTAAIITTQPNELMESVHNRMPAMLLPDLEERWLDPTSLDPAELSELLGPYPANEMTVQPVSSAVNAAGHEGPSLINPVDSAALESD
jgi:putative SOS response-associated peptidase YedK